MCEDPRKQRRDDKNSIRCDVHTVAFHLILYISAGQH